MERFQRWEKYPNKDTLPPGSRNPAVGLSKKLTELAPIVCSGFVDLRIFDISEDGALLSQVSAFEDASQVERQLLRCEHEKPRVRVISLHSPQSILGLNISEPLLRKILTFHNIDADFMHILFSFGVAPKATESGSRNLTNKILEDGSRTLAYLLKYVEANNRSPSQPYSRRQTGIYHHHAPKDKFDLFVLVNPIEESPLENEIIDMVQHRQIAKDICEAPLRLHQLPFALYADNWRWNLQCVGAELEKKHDKIMTLELQKSATAATVNLSFEKVQSLHHLEDSTLLMTGQCNGAIVILEMLQRMSSGTFVGQWAIDSYLDRLQGYDESLTALLARIRSSISLHAYALDLKNQLTAANTNERVSELAEKTGHDTTAVKWITYLTVIYLPGTFVATLFGMNLFLFDQDTRRLVIAKDFWIYAATWLPLTFLTFLGYSLTKAYHRMKEPGPNSITKAECTKCFNG